MTCPAETGSGSSSEASAGNLPPDEPLNPPSGERGELVEQEPVAWRMLMPGGEVLRVQSKPIDPGYARMMAADCNCTVEPLYAALSPPTIEREGLAKVIWANMSPDNGMDEARDIADQIIASLALLGGGGGGNMASRNSVTATPSALPADVSDTGKDA